MTAGARSGCCVMPEQAEQNGSLTTREREIVLLAATGLSNKTIAYELKLSAGTVKVHMHNIFQKLGIRTRSSSNHPGYPFDPKNRRRLRAPGGYARLDASKWGGLARPMALPVSSDAVRRSAVQGPPRTRWCRKVKRFGDIGHVHRPWTPREQSTFSTVGCSRASDRLRFAMQQSRGRLQLARRGRISPAAVPVA